MHITRSEPSPAALEAVVSRRLQPRLLVVGDKGEEWWHTAGDATFAVNAMMCERIRAGVADVLRDGGSRIVAVDTETVLRFVPLEGPRERRVAVFIDTVRPRYSMDAVARRLDLTAREVEVLALILKGYPTRAIASQLNMAHPTAKNHTAAILRKAEAGTRAEVVARILGGDVL
jgi:DNA-binding CsgD family transcriptional regulator